MIPVVFGSFSVAVFWAASPVVTAVPRRASTKYASGVLPRLVTCRPTVTGVPAVSLVLVESGRPDAEAGTGRSLIPTRKGWATALPDTLLKKSTTSIHRPPTGFRTCNWPPTWGTRPVPPLTGPGIELAAVDTAWPVTGSTSSASSVLLSLGVFTWTFSALSPAGTSTW